jgi:hypothetical protein
MGTGFCYAVDPADTERTPAILAQHGRVARGVTRLRAPAPALVSLASAAGALHERSDTRGAAHTAVTGLSHGRASDEELRRS